MAIHLHAAAWLVLVLVRACGAPDAGRGDEHEYDGDCFTVDARVDDAIRSWTDRGVVVTAIVYGVPRWARVGNVNCSPIASGFDIFCTPDDPDDYGRFAGMLASRYDGVSGNGRVANFVIHNEVNANAWFDIGCGQGRACDTATWIQTYVDNYAAAYDTIRSHQSEAKVLLSFEHHFGTDFDRPADANATLSVQSFLTTFAANYICHRMQDAPSEGNLKVGLRRLDGTAKPAWAVWALANHVDDVQPHWYLHRDPTAGTTLVFECLLEHVVYGPHTFLSHEVNCEGAAMMGPVGSIWTAPFPQSSALYRCRNSENGDHYISPDPGCGGGTLQLLLGYARQTE